MVQTSIFHKFPHKIFLKMRRSSAPSFLKSKNSPGIVAKENPPLGQKPPEDSVRSTSRVLSLLNEAPVQSNQSCNFDDNLSVDQNFQDDRVLKAADLPPQESETPTEIMIFEAVYRKMTAKKHKTWEGDGTVEVDGRGAVLKDEGGKELGRVSKVKTGVVFEEGTQLTVSGREVELGTLKRKNSKQQAVPSPILHPAKKSRPSFRIMATARDDDAFPLPTPSHEHQWKFNREGQPVNRVVIEGFLARALRPHQREGVTFLYECVMGMRGPEPGQYWGGLLADEMGLGKTLQCIALIWTLLKQKAYGRGTEIRRALIVAPKTLVDNWEKDILAWLGPQRITIYKVDEKRKLSDYKTQSLAKIAIVSYDTYIRHAAEDREFNEWDLLICDEAHGLKNPDTKKSKALKQMQCRRRILLTGSPCQNNLMEFFEILDLANPGSLGSREEFTKTYKAGIERAGEPDCSEAEAERGAELKEQLMDVTSRFMLRRTSEVILPYLPSKQDLVLMVKAAPLQENIYEEAVAFWARQENDPDCNGCHGGVTTLKAITTLRQISNHPALLKPCRGSIPHDDPMDEEMQCHLVQKMGNQCDINLLEHSGKLQVVHGILQQLNNRNSEVARTKRDRVLIVSYFTQTLNMLEALCRRNNYESCRLDGTTPQTERMPLVNKFNDANSETFVFLLSAKAGGTGLNLTGASRLILFDLDWNPANDQQALARVWRGNQKRPVIIYRLMTTGTIEEKVFQRQIKKSGLNPASSGRDVAKLSKEELKDLFSYYQSDEKNLTHSMLHCECDGSGNNIEEAAGLDNEDHGLFEADEDKEWSIPGIDQLVRWQHYAPCFDPALMQDLELLHVQDKVTFMFLSKVEAPSQ